MAGDRTRFAFWPPNSDVLIFYLMLLLAFSIIPLPDMTIVNPSAAELAYRLNITLEQLSMKTGMLVSAIFPLVAVPLYHRLWKQKEARRYI